MALQLSAAARNGACDAIETAVGTAPILRIYTGAAPADVATAATGTVLVEMTLPSDWLAAASNGAKTILGTWQDTSANATGDAGYFRIFNSAGTTGHMQGTVSANGGGGDLQLQQATVGIVSGQTVTISAFTLTMGGS